jgi:hypothetical protein
MCLRGFVVLFCGLLFLISSLCAPSSSIMPIACVSMFPPAHVKNAASEQPALGCAVFTPPRASVLPVTGAKRGAVRVIAQIKTEVKNTPLSLGGNRHVGIGTASPVAPLHAYIGTSGYNIPVAVFSAGAGNTTVQLRGPAGVGEGIYFDDNDGTTIRDTINTDGSYNLSFNTHSNINNPRLYIQDSTGNVGHSDNRPGFRDAQLGRGSRGKVVAHDGPRTSENGRRNPVIERRLTLTRSLFGYCFVAIPPHCGPVFRA